MTRLVCTDAYPVQGVPPEKKWVVLARCGKETRIVLFEDGICYRYTLTTKQPLSTDFIESGGLEPELARQAALVAETA